MRAIHQQRWQRFKSNRRGFAAFWLFMLLFLLSLGSELIANERPLLLRFNGELYMPFIHTYSEIEFGGEFATEADYHDPFVVELIESKGWILWPPIRFSHDTINFALPVPAPAPPSASNWLGTDDQARDIVASILYGFRISVLFGFVLSFLSAVIGIFFGALMGYRGGLIDLVGQRIIEVFSNMPMLFILIIFASFITPGFWSLLCLLLLFSWMGYVGPVRAEFLRARHLDYVRAAKAIGASDTNIMLKYILPNALVATITFMPFNLAASVTLLTSLDFLGFGLPVGSPSLGHLLTQGKNNLQAPWIGLSAFCVLSVMLSLLVMAGEAVRDAFDPHRHGPKS